MRTHVTAHCIFCGSALTAETTAEHILHNAFGGRKKSRRVICSVENNKFGSSIDRLLVEQFAVIRNLLQVRSGSKELPPSLRRVQAGDQTISVLSDGKLVSHMKPFTIAVSADGAKQLSITASSLEEIERQMPNMAAALGVTEQELREKLVRVQTSRHESYPSPVNFGLSFGGQDAIRSVTKSCLELWSLATTNKEVRGSPYAAAVTFVRNANDAFHESRTTLDFRAHIADEHLISHFGQAFSLIYVASNQVGKVIGHFTIFNVVGFSVVLAEDGGFPNHVSALVNNPLTGEWSATEAENLAIPFSWLEEANHDASSLSVAHGRFERLLAHQNSSADERRIDEVMQHVFDKYALNPDDEIRPDLLPSIIDEVSHAVACVALRLSSETPIPEDVMRRRFLTEKPGT